MRNLRLEKIADMVMKGVTAADIGTDHALLPVMLIEQKKCERVYACDIAEGPLKSAERTVHNAGLAEQIELILSDGFANVPRDADCAVLAGMGYYTAAGILERATERLSSFRQIIVEVNRNVKEMRQWISEHGFTITDEAVVSERGFDYIIISFNTQAHVPYTERELECGPVLIEKNSPEFREYCARQLTALESILAKQTRETENSRMLKHRAEIWRSVYEEAENTKTAGSFE